MVIKIRAVFFVYHVGVFLTQHFPLNEIVTSFESIVFLQRADEGTNSMSLTLVTVTSTDHPLVQSTSESL